MKENKITKITYIIAGIISNIMCATVAYNYCELTYQIKYAGASAPASMAFLGGIPHAICIIICLGVGKIVKNQSKCIN